MKVLCLLAVIVASIAGCASTSAPPTTAKRERVSDDQITVGSRIPRKRADQGVAPVSQVDKQALENERTMSSAVMNGQ
ncbi:hypothetical protein [Massilia sp. SYSU DXS3249]